MRTQIIMTSANKLSLTLSVPCHSAGVGKGKPIKLNVSTVYYTRMFACIVWTPIHMHRLSKQHIEIGNWRNAIELQPNRISHLLFFFFPSVATCLPLSMLLYYFHCRVDCQTLGSFIDSVILPSILRVSPFIRFYTFPFHYRMDFIQMLFKTIW